MESMRSRMSFRLEVTYIEDDRHVNNKLLSLTSPAGRGRLLGDLLGRRAMGDSLEAHVGNSGPRPRLRATPLASTHTWRAARLGAAALEGPKAPCLCRRVPMAEQDRAIVLKLTT